eukprot:TRINITY_DN21770_c0_g1_i1.p1 TRINITY_DN21770_c0_g1~~TRINITY_DN21770_c0_g1_i1.p1  ORF type:complete len:458 (-),score=51.92 TRINITY_DN21770_c0_g1_i1:55-1428(-)
MTRGLCAARQRTIADPVPCVWRAQSKSLAFVVAVAFQLQLAECIGANAGLPPVAPQTGTTSCVHDVASCVQAEGSSQVRMLAQWLGEMPSGPATMTLAQSTGAGLPPATALEVAAFALFRNLGVIVFAHILDTILTCRAYAAHLSGGHGRGQGGGDATPSGVGTNVAPLVPDSRCTSVEPHSDRLSALHHDFESQMRNILISGYSPETGVRSAVIKAAKNMQSDMYGVMHWLANEASIASFVDRGAKLVQSICRRSRILSSHLGMHAWIRTLALPGRGVPAFVFHDEYGTREEMVQTKVANMMKYGGQRSLTLVEVGVGEDSEPQSLLRSFHGMQYIGVLLSQEGRTNDQTLRARLDEKLREFTSRAALVEGTTMDAARALPLGSVDIVVLRVGSNEAEAILDMQLWEARVKAGGLVVGSGFTHETMGGAQAVCKHRHFHEIHLGMGGTFWWFVEPE